MILPDVGRVAYQHIKQLPLEAKILFVIKTLDLHLVAEHAIENGNEGNLQSDVFALFDQFLQTYHVELSYFKCFEGLLLYFHFQHTVGIAKDLVLISFHSLVQ